MAAGDKNGNALPGTLVERDITHPFEYDFYLSSHSAIQGTARPVHYQVIMDEAQVPVNDFQRMVYQHCYQYMRSTTPVSLCKFLNFRDILFVLISSQILPFTMHIWLLTVLVPMRPRAIVRDLVVERNSSRSRQRKPKTESLVRHPLVKLGQVSWWLKMFHFFLWDKSIKMIRLIRKLSRSFALACGTFKYLHYSITNTIFDPCP